MKIRSGDHVDIMQGHSIFNPVFSTGVVIDIDLHRVTGPKALVRFNNKDGKVIESWFPFAALRPVLVMANKREQVKARFAEPA